MIVRLPEPLFPGKLLLRYMVHREDCTKFAPPAEIDPVFAETLSAACKRGVEVLIYRAKIDPPLVTLDVRLPFDGSKIRKGEGD